MIFVNGCCVAMDCFCFDSVDLAIDTDNIFLNEDTISSKRGIPERDISSLCAMGYGSGQMEKLSVRRCRRHHFEMQVDIQTKKLWLEVF